MLKNWFVTGEGFFFENNRKFGKNLLKMDKKCKKLINNREKILNKLIKIGLNYEKKM